MTGVEARIRQGMFVIGVFVLFSKRINKYSVTFPYSSLLYVLPVQEKTPYQNLETWKLISFFWKILQENLVCIKI